MVNLQDPEVHYKKLIKELEAKGQAEEGTLPEGVKWSYSYASGTDSTARKWVAAFDSATRKAYCEAGPVGSVDWNVVKVKLNASGSSCEYVNPILGGKITANITGLQAISTLY